MIKVLLVNLAKKSPYRTFVSLALLKLATFYRGNRVQLVQAGRLPKDVPDLICFSTMFLFNAKRELGFIKAYMRKYPHAKVRVGGIGFSLRPDIYFQDGIEFHKGLLPEVEHLAPDYAMARIPYSYGFTSRGCIRKCRWCVVHSLEGMLKVNPHWRNYLGVGHSMFYAMDNNILACGVDHFEGILKELGSRGFKVDFNQGMDCRIFAKDDRFVEIMKRYQKVFELVRFSWDSQAYDDSVLKTIDMLKREKIGKEKRWYLLFGDRDTKEHYEHLWYRIETLTMSGHNSKVMMYRDIYSGKSSPLAKRVNRYFSDQTTTGSIGVGLTQLHRIAKDKNDFINRVYSWSGKINRGVPRKCNALFVVKT